MELKKKIKDSWSIAIDEIEAVRKDGKRLVFTNGCFDILHAGHVQYLESAKKLGDFLVLGLNSDASVHRLKGKDRPINSVRERAIVLAALASVDMVVVFEEDTPLELIKALSPDVLVKGGDYQKEEIVGADFVESSGGEVKTLQFVPGESSSDKIKKLAKQ